MASGKNIAPGTPLSQAGGLPPRKDENPVPKAEALPPGLRNVIVTAAQDRWMGRVASSYNPERIEQVLRGAILSGNLVDQWELFDLIEDTSGRINKNLNKRKRAVMNYLRSFESWSEDEQTPTPEADRRKKLVANALWRMRPKADEDQNGFDSTIYDMLDAIGKGVSVLEPMWEIASGGKKFGLANDLWTKPQCTRWIHPRFYGYPQNQSWLGLNVTQIAEARSLAGATATATATSAPLMPLNNLPVVADGIYARFPENKFLICTYKGKTGHPAGAALLRRLAFWWVASNFTGQWFLNFAQIFGLPIRWANYDPNQPGLLEKVLEMLENMGSNAYGAFPTGTSLELKEAMKAGADNPQVALLNYADKQYDLAILGQSGTTEVAGPGKTGGSMAANKVLEGVEEEIILSDANFVCTVFNEQFIPMIISLNYSDTEMLPELCLEPRVIEDLKALTDNYKTATDAHVITPNPDDEAFFRKKLNLPAMPEAVTKDWAASGGVRKNVTSTSPGGSGGSGGSDFVAAHAHAHEDETAKVVDRALEDLTGVSQRWLGGVKPFFFDLIAKANNKNLSDADFQTALAKAAKEIPELFSELKPQELQTALENAMGAAAANGAMRGFLQRGKAVAA